MTLPPGATFVVANCLAPMNKAATSHYNCRVMECRLACQIMAKKAGKNTGFPLICVYFYPCSSYFLNSVQFGNKKGIVIVQKW